jgi:hypothetical protein
VQAQVGQRVLLYSSTPNSSSNILVGIQFARTNIANPAENTITHINKSNSYRIIHYINGNPRKFQRTPQMKPLHLIFLNLVFYEQLLKTKYFLQIVSKGICSKSRQKPRVFIRQYKKCRFFVHATAQKSLPKEGFRWLEMAKRRTSILKRGGPVRINTGF